MPLATLSCGERALISSPPSLTEPSFILSIPKIAFMAVDLPAPFGPTITAICPRSTATVQSCNISAPLP